MVAIPIGKPLACIERTVKKYQMHMKAYSLDHEMDAMFNRTLSAVEFSIHTYEKTLLGIEENVIGFSDWAKVVKSRRSFSEGKPQSKRCIYGTVRQGTIG